MAQSDVPTIDRTRGKCYRATISEGLRVSSPPCPEAEPVTTPLE